MGATQMVLSKRLYPSTLIVISIWMGVGIQKGVPKLVQASVTVMMTAITTAFVFVPAFGA